LLGLKLGLDLITLLFSLILGKKEIINQNISIFKKSGFRERVSCLWFGTNGKNSNLLTMFLTILWTYGMGAYSL
jgi:hypothetical protein